jgi:hypothetical protein
VLRPGGRPIRPLKRRKVGKMSGDPRRLKATLLGEADTAQQQAFAKMLAEQCAIAESQTNGKAWLFIPTPAETDRLRRFVSPPDYDRCPKCRKGRVVLEVYHGNVGDSLHVVCRWGQAGCDFQEYVSDDE